MIGRYRILNKEKVLNKKFQYERNFNSVTVSKYKMEDGVKALLLSCLEGIVNILDSEKPNIFLLEMNINDICKYTSVKSVEELENIKKLYIEDTTKILRIMNLPSMKWIKLKKKIIASSNNLMQEDFIVLRCVRSLTHSFVQEVNYIMLKKDEFYHFCIATTLIQVAIELLENSSKYITAANFQPVINIWPQNGLEPIKFEVVNDTEYLEGSVLQKPKIYFIS